MKQFNNLTIEQSILDTLQYFSFFDYPPTAEEIHTFLKKKARKRQITSILEKMEKKGVVKSWRLDDRGLRIEGGSLRMKDRRWKEKQKFFLSSIFYHLSSTVNTSRYTLHQYNILPLSSRAERNNSTSLRSSSFEGQAIQQFNNFTKRQQISIDKINSWKFKLYIKLLSFFPQIKLIGLSGSVAMLNAGESHDIDLFIIIAKNRLWTGRFIALVLAQILGIRRKRELPIDVIPAEAGIQNNNWIPDQVGDDKGQHSDKVCLNLFFDESNLKIPKFKQTDYVAHEVLQMKPVEQKDDIYLRFIDTNRWVFDIFPNSKNDYRRLLADYHRFSYPRKSVINPWKSLTNNIEALLRKLQLYFIRRHQTTEIITSTQLWFHPDDFSQKIKR